MRRENNSSYNEELYKGDFIMSVIDVIFMCIIGFGLLIIGSAPEIIDRRQNENDDSEEI